MSREQAVEAMRRSLAVCHALSDDDLTCLGMAVKVVQDRRKKGAQRSDEALSRLPVTRVEGL